MPAKSFTTHEQIAGDAVVVIKLGYDADGVVQVDVQTPKDADPALGLIAGGMTQVGTTLGLKVSELSQAGRLRLSLKSGRTVPVTRALGHVADVVGGAALDLGTTDQDLTQRQQVSTDAVDVVFHGNSRELDSLIDSLTPPTPDDDDDDGPGSDDDHQAEARARLRLEALYRKLIRDSFTVKQLGELRLSRQRLLQLRGEARLFAVEVPYHKGLLHPRWQFDEGNRPRPEMPELIAAASDGGLDAVAFHELMLNPDAGGELAPIDLLDRGRVEEVLGILRAGGA